jgi:hypothetical protein
MYLQKVKSKQKLFFVGALNIPHEKSRVQFHTKMSGSGALLFAGSFFQKCGGMLIARNGNNLLHINCQKDLIFRKINF